MRVFLTTPPLHGDKAEKLKETLAEALGVKPEDVFLLPPGASFQVLKDAPSYEEVEKKKAEEREKAEKEAEKAARQAEREHAAQQKAADEKAAREAAHAERDAAKAAHPPGPQTTHQRV